MFVMPYRAKNPPPRPPYCTYGLIIANVLIYLVTAENLLFVRTPVLQALALSHSEFTFVRIITSMFLHGNPLHILGNMLFLWIFGAAVEGRLGPAKFLLLYFLTGAFGDIVQNFILGAAHPHEWNLGASGAIMGVAGAYLYMFPFATIRVLWSYNIRFHVSDWSAQWVILYFLAFDIIDGVLYQGLDGVAHLVHISAAVLGFCLPMLLRMHRDSEETSAAQAMRVDAGGDLSILALHEIEALVDSSPNDPHLIQLFCVKAVQRPDVHGPERCVEMLIAKGDLLIDALDPSELVQIALVLPKEPKRLPNRFWMRLAGKLEIAGRDENALSCYDKILQADRSNPDAEMAFIKMARLVERLMPDSTRAADLYSEQLDRFPHGAQATSAANALRRLGIAYRPSEIPPLVGDAPPEPDRPFGAKDPIAPSDVEEDSSGLQPLIPRIAGATPAPSTGSAIEPGYNVGETSGMALRPIGPPQ